jgi:hypothetical protein
MSQFYEKLGRFNSWLFAGVGLLILGILAVLAFSMLSSRGYQEYDDNEGQLARSVPAEPDQLMPELRSAEPIAGTSIMTVEVSAPEDYRDNEIGMSSAIKKKYEENERNILFVNLDSGDSRYLLPDNSRPLTQWHVLPNDERGVLKSKLFYVAQVMVKPDKQTPATKPKFEILVGRFSDGTQLWLLRDVLSLDQVSMTADGDIALLYSTGSNFTFARVDGETFKIEATKPVPIMMMPKPQSP